MAGRVVRVGRYRDGVLETNADGWFTVDPVRARSLTVEVYRPGLDLKTVHSWRWGDPRLQKTVIGKVEINTARKVSEFKLIVPKGR